MSIKDDIDRDVKAAMRAREREKTAALRLIMSAIKQIEVDERKQLSDADVTAILARMVKQRRDSIAQYERGGRPDLATREQAEIDLIQSYLPQPLDEEEVDALITQAIADTGAATMKDLGRVMAALKPKLQGRADLGAVSAKVKSKLS